MLSPCVDHETRPSLGQPALESLVSQLSPHAPCMWPVPLPYIWCQREGNALAYTIAY